MLSMGHTPFLLRLAGDGSDVGVEEGGDVGLCTMEKACGRSTYAWGELQCPIHGANAQMHIHICNIYIQHALAYLLQGVVDDPPHAVVKTVRHVLAHDVGVLAPGAPVGSRMG